jgi:hypothetical protein
MNGHLWLGVFGAFGKTGVFPEELLGITAFFNVGMAFDKAQWYVR